MTPAKRDRHIDETSGKYFHILLNIADDDLDPYQYRLLGHYLRVGTCWQGVRTTARITRMSVGKVVSTREWLAEHGWISVTPGADGETFTITITNRMSENVQRYIDAQNNQCSPGERGVHEVNGGVHEVNERITHEEEPSNKTDSSASAEAPLPPKPASRRSRGPKPAAAPPIAKDASDPETPGSDAPLTPKPIQAHVAIIDAWRAALNGDAPITKNPYGGQYGKVAVALAEAGITPAQVTAYTVAMSKDPFWRGKVLPLEYIAKNIRRWMKTQEPANYAATTSSPASDTAADSIVGGNSTARPGSGGTSAPVGKIPAYLHARLGIKNN